MLCMQETSGTAGYRPNPTEKQAINRYNIKVTEVIETETENLFLMIKINISGSGSWQY